MESNKTTIHQATQVEGLGLVSTTLLVVANIIGAGVFGTVGSVTQSVPSVFGMLLCWLIIGLMALSGALSYSELAARYPRSGGEYNFLSRIYHPALGFTSGFVSLVVGFSASVAFVAGVFANYLGALIPGISQPVAAVSLVLVLTAMHSFSLKYGASVQNVITVVKVGIIVVLIVAGLLLEGQVPPQNISLMPTDSDWDLIFSASFAQGLISVFYAYLGWNAAVYIMGEVKDAHVTVPKALLMGTGVVIVLYLLLNYTILYRVPLSELAGAEGDVAGKVAAQNIFGDIGAKLLTIFIAFALVSSASSMIIAGPRVTQMMGQDYPIYSLMGKTNKAGVPVYAILLQSIVTIGLIVSTSYFFLLQYIGFTLSIFSLLTVVGVYIARIKEGAPAEGLYRVPGYPFTPAIFLLISGWMVVRALMGSVEVALAGIGTFALGITLFYFSAKATKA